MGVILVVDDEPLQREILKNILSDEGYEAHAASSGEEAVKMVRSVNPDVVLTDLKMKQIDGIELMEKIKSEGELPAVILMTAFGSVSSAVEAMKKGAFDYLTKPLEKEMVLLTVRRALNTAELLRKNRELRDALYDKIGINEIVCKSGVMKEVVKVIQKVSDTSVTVLILGESGTGKELVTRAIHFGSSRASKPFTAINCAAIPENLLESELFGCEPGAFTGASARRAGLFEASNGGTVFLDEIGDLPLLTQSKILRILQEKEVRRLGGRDAIRIDVRIIAATNKDLEKEIKNGRFREDLYYRLRIVTIDLPPLRERREDIPELAGHFLEKYNREFGKRIRGVQEPVMKAFLEYHWPGNIRQMESVIERAVLMCEGSTVSMKEIKGELRTSQKQEILDLELPDEGINFEEFENELLKKAMAKANNVAAKAAKLLGMSYKTFWYRWEKLNAGNSSPKKEDVP